MRTMIAYGLMTVGAVGVFLAVREYGTTLEPPGVLPAEPLNGTSSQPDVLLRVLIALTAVVIAGWLLAKVFASLSQPPVIGEVLAGILLGPSLLGPEISALVLPPSVAPALGVIAQLGVILYMFLIGLELNPGSLRHQAPAVVAISHASILIPFLMGALLAVGLYPGFAAQNVPFTSFALFIGVAMSVTAFPVLARILSDRHMTRTELGGIALSCAAANDVAAWCLLAVVIGIAQAKVGQGLAVAGGTLAYIAFMFLVFRHVLGRITSQWNEARLSRDAVALIFVLLLISALATEAIGVHAIFGAFTLGAVIPHESAVARTLTRQLDQVVTVLLLPTFFAFVGMRTRIDLLAEPSQWLICGLIILLATAGKFGGTLAAARLTGLGWRDSAALGALMNTRGLMEMIVLNIGLEMRVISPTVFAMMVIMALVTTMATSPVLALLKPRAAPDDPN